ncbi:MAG TPA: preprotein translocase subunit YajC [Candidatus Cybelea sp.]|nr:preprotein translocase subunit YajC [Candidatus Cybelea sp.]
MHVTCFSALLALAAPPAGSQPGPAQSLFGSPIVMMLLIGVMMYFLMIRPNQLRAKQQAKLLSALKSGDKVITSSGIIAVVVTVRDKTVTIRSADAKFEVTKASITEIVADDASTPTAS